MSYKGTVKNGVVVLEPGAGLPDGTSVRVEPESPAADAPSSPEGIAGEDPLLRMLKRAGPTGIADLSVNLDHYLYGHPKVTDGQ